MSVTRSQLEKAGPLREAIEQHSVFLTNLSEYQRYVVSKNSKIGAELKVWSILNTLIESKKQTPESDLPDITKWIRMEDFRKYTKIPPLNELFSDIDTNFSFGEMMRALIAKGRISDQTIPYIDRKLKLEWLATKCVAFLTSSEFLIAFNGLTSWERRELQVIFSSGVNQSEVYTRYLAESVKEPVPAPSDIEGMSVFNLYQFKREWGNEDTLTAARILHELASLLNINFVIESKYISVDAQKVVMGNFVESLGHVLRRGSSIFGYPSDIANKLFDLDIDADDFVNNTVQTIKEGLSALLNDVPGPIRTPKIDFAEILGCILSLLELGNSFKRFVEKRDTEALVDLASSFASSLELLEKSLHKQIYKRVPNMTTVLSTGAFSVGLLSSIYSMNVAAHNDDSGGMIGSYLIALGGAFTFMGLVPLGVVCTIAGALLPKFLTETPFQAWVKNCYFGIEYNLSKRNYDIYGPQSIKFEFYRTERQVRSFQALSYPLNLTARKASVDFYEILPIIAEKQILDSPMYEHLQELKLSEETMRSYKAIIIEIEDSKFIYHQRKFNKQTSLWQVSTKIYPIIGAYIRFWDDNRFSQRISMSSGILDLYTSSETGFLERRGEDKRWPDNDFLLLDGAIVKSEDEATISRLRYMFLMKNELTARVDGVDVEIYLYKNLKPTPNTLNADLVLAKGCPV